MKKKFYAAMAVLLLFSLFANSAYATGYGNDDRGGKNNYGSNNHNGGWNNGGWNDGNKQGKGNDDRDKDPKGKDSKGNDSKGNHSKDNDSKGKDPKNDRDKNPKDKDPKGDRDDRDKDKWDKDKWDKDPKGDHGKAGTSLTVTKTAEGIWVKKRSFDWSIEKTAIPERPVIEQGKLYALSYTLTANKVEVSDVEQIGVRGSITVTNGGERPTQGLKLVDQVQVKTSSGQYRDLEGATLTIIPTEQLQPGETKTYPYEFYFTPVEGAQYRNTVHVTITNHSGKLGQEFGPNPKADFRLPSEPTLILEDDQANVIDNVVCPEGFTCEMEAPGTWTLTDSAVITYTMNVTNVSAACTQIVDIVNQADLTESTTGQIRSATDYSSVFTGCCTCQ